VGEKEVKRLVEEEGEGEESDDSDKFHNLQAGHGTKMAGTIYARGL
jgi:hypothetical protein